MALEFLAALFGPRLRLPADQATRIPRRARKIAGPHAGAIQATLDKISALPGIADVKTSKRVPRGFTALMRELLHHIDEYHQSLRESMAIQGHRPGEPGGCNACYTAPVGVSAIEALNIYRSIRGRREFPELVRQLAELGQEQYQDVQAGASGKDTEKLRFAGKAVQQGRLVFAKRLHPCPMLDTGAQRCRIWETRPIVCRMHHVVGDTAVSKPDHPEFPKGVKAKNLRLPVRAQVTLSQLDKRMALELAPFLYVTVPQLVQLAEGQQIIEVGEAPTKMQQDGNIVRPANRNVGHAKKFQKDKRKPKRK